MEKHVCVYVCTNSNYKNDKLKYPFYRFIFIM